MKLIPVLAAAMLAVPVAAQAQIATPGGFARSGVAGPMTAHGGAGDRANAGGGIPYVRPVPGGYGALTRQVPPPRQNYGRFGYGRGYDYGYGYGGYGRPAPGVYGPGRQWVYDRPWERRPYATGGVYVR